MRGPTPFDRLLAVNAIGTTVILGIALHGYALGRPEFVDISILYAVINFIGTFAVLKLFNTGGLGDAGGRAKPDLDSVMADGQVRNSKQTGTKSGGRS
jgi:multicomponent Na+:H+ antiporter subunit F